MSIGTIYNYYQNKGDILVAIVSMEVNEVLNAGRGVVANPPANVGDALDTLLGIYIEHSLHLSQQGDVAAGDGDLDAAARQPVRPGLYRARPRADRPDPRPGRPAARDSAWCARISTVRRCGELVFNNMNMMFIEFVKRDEARIPELRAAIRRQNRILVAAIVVCGETGADRRNP